MTATVTDKGKYIQLILDEPMENVAVAQAVGVTTIYYA